MLIGASDRRSNVATDSRLQVVYCGRRAEPGCRGLCSRLRLGLQLPVSERGGGHACVTCPDGYCRTGETFKNKRRTNVDPSRPLQPRSPPSLPPTAIADRRNTGTASAYLNPRARPSAHLTITPTRAPAGPLPGVMPQRSGRRHSARCITSRIATPGGGNRAIPRTGTWSNPAPKPVPASPQQPPQPDSLTSRKRSQGTYRMYRKTQCQLNVGPIA